MPPLGSISTEPQKRSGWSFSARMASSRSLRTPIMTFSTPKRSMLSSTTATVSTLSSISAGRSLNMYWAGKENSSRLSVSRSWGSRKR